MNKNYKKIITLRRFNNALSVVVVALSLYIALAPFIPAGLFWWRAHYGTKPALVVANTPTNNTKSSEVFPEDNTLVIPALGLQETIYDGNDATTLNKGAWHRPRSSSPDEGGNTVIAGHRFVYAQTAAVFYSLDKVKIGDHIVVYWQKKKYIYAVATIKIVPPTAIEVEADTTEPMITLYTCTPLWTAKSRLVVQAKLVEKIQ